MSLVCDSSAMLAYLRNESGGDFVRELLENADVLKLAHAVNLCEVFYDFWRKADHDTAQAAIESCAALARRWRGAGAALALKSAATVTARSGATWRLSLPRSGATGTGWLWAMPGALARRLDADFVTADRGELEAVAVVGICRVTFIR